MVSTFFDTFGRPELTKDADGDVNMTEYETATDGVTKSITDVNYSSLSTGEKATFDLTEHLLTVLRYVERNPLRAKLVRRAQDWR